MDYIDQVREYFKEIKEICTRDNGSLWGRPMSVPVFFMDKQTRELYANQNDSSKSLEDYDDVYYGHLPEKYGVANTSISWNGELWVMLILPVSKEQKERQRLFMHESFHAIQEELGFPSRIPENSHLDKAIARTWLKLEWLALKEALNSDGKDKYKAITNALLFRKYRHLLYPNSRNSERQLENHEGLAEYTGMILSGYSDEERIREMTARLNSYMDADSYINSFAYWSGPAYGILLFEKNQKWNLDFAKYDNLGDYLQKLYKVNLSEDIETLAKIEMSRFGGEEILALENKLEVEKLEVINNYKKYLISDNSLQLNLSQFNIQYEPAKLISLEGYGTIYPNLRLTDEWGVLEAKDGALMNSSWSMVTVSKPDSITGDIAYGHGWTLAINSDWEIGQSGDNGHYIIRHK
ncbi:MAG: hypothetical protein ABIJ45_03410 [Candidatus Zixiibacteriota bacterium]